MDITDRAAALTGNFDRERSFIPRSPETIFGTVELSPSDIRREKIVNYASLSGAGIALITALAVVVFGIFFRGRNRV